jgi:hypothetical protein
MITNELFIGHFTGQLATIRTKDGRVLTFKRPYPRIEKHRAYNLQIDGETGQTRLIPINNTLPGGQR